MKITDAQLKQIYRHAQETYPDECCGFLLGNFDDGGLVHQVKRATNQNTDRTDRFIISPEEFAQTQFVADDAGLDIIGIYHSHPDWPPIPSQTDLESAWEDVYYLITSVLAANSLPNRSGKCLGRRLLPDHLGSPKDAA
jgi:proteasome lid subunit RPN8/RPN11